MFRRIIASLVCVAFLTTNLHYSYAQGFSVNRLPAPGQMVTPAQDFVPLTLKGLVLHPENALRFDFLMDTGNSRLSGEPLKEEALKLMKYFLTALTMPEDDMWVNLSPYEKGRVVENNFGRTLMGRDLLAEDYVLKQLTASLIYPEKELGQNFWKEVYSKINSKEESDLAIETLNKVWIVPSEAVVWEHDGKVMIIKSHLKVMLEEDYVALKNSAAGLLTTSQRSIASQAVRNIILPVLEKQVNEGKHFAQLRQMYQAMILATWYKKALKESIMAKVYADKGKIKGVDNQDAGDIEAIYQQYLEAFKQGVFNYIKEDVDEKSGEVIPRKYFSGGITLRSGIVSLITALSIWSGSLTLDQERAIAQSTRPVGQTVVVEGLAVEANQDGQAIRVAQASVTTTEERIKDTLSVARDNAVMTVNEFQTWWQARSDFQQWLWITLTAVFGLGSIGLGIRNYLDSPEYKYQRVRRMVLHNDLNNLINFLNSSDLHYREFAMEALDELVTDPQSQYQLAFDQLKSKESANRGWAIKMFAKASSYKIQEKTDLVRVSLNDVDWGVREPAREALNKLVIDQETQYQLGLGQIKSQDYQNIRWAIKMLTKVPNYKTQEKIDLVTVALNDEEVKYGDFMGRDFVWESAREALDKLVTDKEIQYQLGVGQIKRRNHLGILWGIKMLAKASDYKVGEKITLVKALLYVNSSQVREAAQEFLDKLVVDPEEQYQLGLGQFKSAFADNRDWAIKMFGKTLVYKSNDKKKLVVDLLDDDSQDFREKAHRLLDKLVTDSAAQYQLGLDQLKSKYFDNQIWAISMLVKSKDKRVIESIAELLNIELKIDSDYKLYNAASDALYFFGDSRSGYRYQFHDGIDGHYTEGLSDYEAGIMNSQYGSGGQAPYGKGDFAEWVAGRPAYWEKVERSDAPKSNGPDSTLKKLLGIVSLTTLLSFGSGAPSVTQATGFVDAVGQSTSNTLVLPSANTGFVEPINFALDHSQIYAALAGGNVDAVVARGNQAVPDLIQLLGHPFVGENAKEVLVALGQDISQKDIIIKSLHSALNAFSANISETRAQQIAIRDVLTQLGAGWWEKMSDGGRLFLGLFTLFGLGGAWYLKYRNSKGRLVSENRRLEGPTADAPEQLGGISLDSNLMNLQIRRDGNGIPLPVSQQPLDAIDIQGFVPQILDIKMINLVDFLGLNSVNQEPALARL